MAVRDTQRSGIDGPQTDGNGFEKKADETGGGGHLRSRVIKRSLVVGGHKTSVSLEDVFWNELRSIAEKRHIHLSQLVAGIDAGRQHCNLSSAIRLFVYEHSCEQPATEQQGLQGHSVKSISK
jgi:predicted DNA-binding ribbon-helix-helix protein